MWGGTCSCFIPCNLGWRICKSDSCRGDEFKRDVDFALNQVHPPRWRPHTASGPAQEAARPHLLICKSVSVLEKRLHIICSNAMCMIQLLVGACCNRTKHVIGGQAHRQQRKVLGAHHRRAGATISTFWSIHLAACLPVAWLMTSFLRIPGALRSRIEPIRALALIWGQRPDTTDCAPGRDAAGRILCNAPAPAAAGPRAQRSELRGPQEHCRRF